MGWLFRMKTSDTQKATTEKEFHAVNIDDFTEDVFDWLGSHQDGGAGHFARFTGTKKECVKKLLDNLKPFVEKQMYNSDDYGYKLDEN